MRKSVSIFIFSAALFIGIFFLPENIPTIYEKIYPVFGQDEINLLIGKKVTNKSSYSARQRGWKFPLDGEEKLIAEVLQNGETGTVVDLQKVLVGKSVGLQKTMKNCGLLVKWDEKNKDGRDMFSCQGRFSSRAFLEFE